jgi:hypothetical protein
MRGDILCAWQSRASGFEQLIANPKDRAAHNEVPEVRGIGFLRLGRKMTDKEPIQGELPTAEDEFYHSWGQEIRRDSLKVLTDMLRQLAVLGTAILGGSVAFFDKLPHGARGWFFGCVLLSVASALYGLMPFAREDVDLDSITGLKALHCTVLRWRRWLLWLSAVTLLVGFAGVFLCLL